MQRQSIVSIQSRIRGLNARNKYEIKPLPHKEMTSCKTFVRGNDPEMPAELKKFHEPKDKIAVIATSGMRAVWIACLLGNKNQIPKIYLVDNSENVHIFWDAMHSLMLTAQGEQDFISKLKIFLQKNPQVYHYEPSLYIYFEELFDTYSFNYVRRVILHTSLIKQSWADAELFDKLKNFIELHGITKTYLYPSNIVSCVEEFDQETILRNIQKIAPALTIHTDLTLRHHPENVFLTTDQNPEVVKQTLFHENSIQGAINSQTNVPRIIVTQDFLNEIFLSNLINLQMGYDSSSNSDKESYTDSSSDFDTEDMLSYFLLSRLIINSISREHELEPAVIPVPEFNLQRLNKRYNITDASFFQPSQQHVVKKTEINHGYRL